MYWIESERVGYAGRVGQIRAWLTELGRQTVRTSLTIEIDGESMSSIRTSHSVKIISAHGEETVVLTKEEFLDDYGLFELSAAPKLRAAIERLKAA
jgi:hypothetical protein